MIREPGTKAELRKIYREKRSRLSLADMAALSRRIADQFFAGFNLTKLAVLSTFIRIPKFNEIDTSTIYYRLWLEFPAIRTGAPAADLVAGTIVTVEFGPSSELIETRWGIREPLGPVIPPDQIDLVLVPLLCYDRGGHRIGYGKGFYDRLLRAVRSDCLKIGLSYFPPLEMILDAGEHDIRLDACVTPDEVTRFSQQECP
jgi:5-formyltetrahydrofolate cyclo-ligase